MAGYFRHYNIKGYGVILCWQLMQVRDLFVTFVKIFNRFSYSFALEICMPRPVCKGGVTGVVTPPPKFFRSKIFWVNLWQLYYSDSTVFKFCTSMWLFSVLAPALYKKGCGLLAAIILPEARIHGCMTLKVTKILLLISF